MGRDTEALRPLDLSKFGKVGHSALFGLDAIAVNRIKDVMVWAQLVRSNVMQSGDALQISRYAHDLC